MHVINHIPQPSKCLLLALSGHCRRAERCLLSGVKQTSAELCETPSITLFRNRAEAADFFAILLRRTSNRDARTRSRWASAMKNAVKNKVRPADLKGWLKDGGRISGRAK